LKRFIKAPFASELRVSDETANGDELIVVEDAREEAPGLGPIELGAFCDTCDAWL